MGWNVWLATALQQDFIGFDVNIREGKKMIVDVWLCVCVCVDGGRNGRQQSPLVVAINDSIIVNFT